MEKVSDIISYFKSSLEEAGDKEEVISWAYLSIEYILGFNRSDCILYANNKLSNLHQLKFQAIIKELNKQRPIQHILGNCEFYGLPILVNHHVLIPRPETEELVNWILKHAFRSALDIGTGSGCIAISLAKHTKAQVSALDISKEALELASKNAIANDVDITFFSTDILTSKLNKKYDLFVSNPPYLVEKDKRYINANVLDYEPHLALFTPNNHPLLFYERIISLASVYLNKDGLLFFEINEKYSKQIIKLLYGSGFVDIELKKDINDKDRMIKAILK
ncbi:MAG: peptide chain release factor N(5)-glutamine methyltransferase [Bacteroidota bacterium]|nr:peptide chain release factor N(5)-glutamine methyltransferase [Bacteroidota bacterium]